ncbi:hypothetical protein DPMN_052824 [Dreissena polymorpha]|uniref:Uncharacterized protein n=1 Tax=Dreissena polymorpha TaxID=45954 RepID=A0A9D4CKC3_DREPO|nr:hypothetical protein DPMN_052824 [Dreissena polymorpha]
MLVYAGEALYSLQIEPPRQSRCTLVCHCIHHDLHHIGNAGVRCRVIVFTAICTTSAMLLYAVESLYSPRFAPPRQCRCTLVSHYIHDLHHLGNAGARF